LSVIPGSTGTGVTINGGSATGYAVELQTTNANAIQISAGDGDGINISGDASGIRVSGGSNGIFVSATGAESPGIAVTAGADGNAVDIRGNGAGAALYASSETRAAIDVISSANDGISVAGGGSGIGIKVRGGITGNGVDIEGGNTSGIGFRIVSYGDSDGINVLSNGGNGLTIISDSLGAHGVELIGGNSGDDLHLATPSSNLPIVVSGSVDANVISIDSSVPAAEKLALSANSEVVGTVLNTTLVPSTTVFEVSLTSITPNIYKDRWLMFTTTDGNVLDGCGKPIVSYDIVGGVARITVLTLPTAPKVGDAFVIV
jgi:hypothetical protein